MQVTDSSAPARGDSLSPVVEADERFLAAFENCELPEDQWTHLAHIRAAWVCLSLASPAEALMRIREGILRYNTEVLKRRHKYHETVTVAYTGIVADRMLPGELWSDFRERIGDLLDTGNPVLLRYYSKNRLFSDEARAAFVKADLRQLPLLADR